MSPVLSATAVLLCLATIAAGIVMLQPSGLGSRFVSDVEAEEAEPWIRRMYRWAGDRFGDRLLGLLSARRLGAIRHQIDAAGRPEGLTVSGYVARKAFWTLAAGGFGVAVLVLQGNVLAFVLFIIFGWIVTDMWLSRLASARQDRIDRDMPDFLDILAGTVSAGVRFRSALERVADAMDGPLSEEVTTTLRQMEIGASRRAAFEGLRDRNDSSALSTFVTALLQAEELGSPLAEALLELAADMRNAFHQDARRRAARAVPRVALVLAMIVAPAALILLGSGLLIGSLDTVGELFEVTP